jgi:hypothetical protein
MRGLDFLSSLHLINDLKNEYKESVHRILFYLSKLFHYILINNYKIESKYHLT